MKSVLNRSVLLGAVVVLGLAAALLLGSAVIGNAPPTPAAGPTGSAVPASFEGPATAGDLQGAVTSLQARLGRLPGDWRAWASLGGAYVQQARITADPAFYAKAEGAFARSLQEHPHGNEPALTGQASLAAGRHDFDAALDLARMAVDVNPYGAAAHGVLGDALLELGRYDEAFEAFQRMVDLRPGVPSYARASYAWELRGNIPAARDALEQALAAAYSPADAAFVRFYLGELAWNAGDPEAADRHYAQGLREDGSFVPLMVGRAKVAAAQGRTRAAIRKYTTVVGRQPQPSYLIELGDLYASLGDRTKAQQHYDLVTAQQRLLSAAGVNVDLELALYDADHGSPKAALRAASAELRKRRSVFVEDAYAWALHVNGRSSEALVHARRAQRLGTRSAQFAYHKGMIEKSLGMDDAARADLRRALRINPHFSTLQAPRARRALEDLGPTP
ncbi:MAG: tetratricopeptide repeat protein [Euzebyales bacterium]|nr:tetratricopeptide repeat protein [Euzebyales bacterium]